MYLTTMDAVQEGTYGRAFSGFRWPHCLSTPLSALPFTLTKFLGKATSFFSLAISLSIVRNDLVQSVNNFHF